MLENESQPKVIGRDNVMDRDKPGKRCRRSMYKALIPRLAVYRKFDRELKFIEAILVVA